MVSSPICVACTSSRVEGTWVRGPIHCGKGVDMPWGVGHGVYRAISCPPVTCSQLFYTASGRFGREGLVTW